MQILYTKKRRRVAHLRLEAHLSLVPSAGVPVVQVLEDLLAVLRGTQLRPDTVQNTCSGEYLYILYYIIIY